MFISGITDGNLQLLTIPYLPISDSLSTHRSKLPLSIAHFENTQITGKNDLSLLWDAGNIPMNGKISKKKNNHFQTSNMTNIIHFFFRFILFQQFSHNIIAQRVHFIISFTGNSPPDYSPLPTVPVRQDVIWKFISRPLYHVHFNVIRTHSRHNYLNQSCLFSIEHIWRNSTLK